MLCEQRGYFLAIALSAFMFYLNPAYAYLSAPVGWFLEGNFGSNRLSNVTYPGNVSSSGIGGNLNLGYKFMPFFTLEIGYTRYNDTHIKDQTNTRAATIKYYSYDLAGRGIVPIEDSGVELFAKLGVGRNNAHTRIVNTQAAANVGIGSSQRSDTGVYFGVGGQYYFMPELAGIIQWQRMGIKNSNSVGTQDLYSVGVSFIFD